MTNQAKLNIFAILFNFIFFSKKNLENEPNLVNKYGIKSETFKL